MQDKQENMKIITFKSLLKEDLSESDMDAMCYINKLLNRLFKKKFVFSIAQPLMY